MPGRLVCYGIGILTGMPLLFGVVTVDSPTLFGLNIIAVLLITFIGDFI
ncbi:hypothetical protein JL857_20580 [Vibrio parahaemolyticus]|uniref:Uncharacterized protein n=1 Tax=Vibrio parahaemolyticus TaxID=670 RepID=A0A9Q3UH65_VIBPH|nr:hypothetical protein [Vibrio parahaemolyticus]MCC3807530.1 hypothetical protein [Vibrio parahaemolyticus]MCI9696498.1 hypothetical protein [Vibrio parahaemolyticus]MCI9711038.1 hypothetical protein [Vibrio parahaemolyticus]MCI9715918.1 hypothetical protein [Vibrio parahaemolyticus]